MNYAVEPSEAVGMSARRLERIRPAMQSYIDRGVFAGINTLIAQAMPAIERLPALRIVVDNLRRAAPIP